MADFKKGKGTAQGVCYAGHGILLQYPFGPVVIIAPNAAALQAVQSQKSATRSPPCRVGIQRAGMAASLSPSNTTLASSARVFR